MVVVTGFYSLQLQIYVNYYEKIDHFIDFLSYKSFKEQVLIKFKTIKAAVSCLGMITVIGIFETYELAEEAASYLLANGFESKNVDVHQVEAEERIADFFNDLFDEQSAAAHTAASLHGTIVTIHALSIMEAQEAVDVLNNYGGIDVSIPGSKEVLSRIVERAVNSWVRLRD
jgi:hypothetical protein